MALWSCVVVILKLLATSAHGVVSSNRCFSKVQNIAAASTRMGVRSSHFWNTSSVDCGRILVLQYFSISSLPTAVVAVFGGGGGVEISDPEAYSPWTKECCPLLVQHGFL